MTHFFNTKTHFWLIIVILVLITSCGNQDNKEALSENLENKVIQNNATSHQIPWQKFKEYWYSGKAEITSYKLEQARYGEIHQGQAVLIYVTEDFLPHKQVKADQKSNNTVSVLKLNATKKFNTGIYPYSVMQSTFFPVSNNQHAIKITSSIQEWCGQTFSQLNNKDQFEIKSYSYFETAGDTFFKREKSILENELWVKLRINPKSLPTGDVKIIPALEYFQLNQKEQKAYQAKADLKSSSYTLEYPELNRTLTIEFNPVFPHQILGWKETVKHKSDKTTITKAVKLASIKSAYWKKNTIKDTVLRTVLKLH